MSEGAGVPGPDLRIEFTSLAQWRSFVASHKVCTDPAFIERIASRIAANGFDFEFLERHVNRDEMQVSGTNYRETFSFSGVNARKRAVLDETLRVVGGMPRDRCRIYSPEALSEFALLLRGKFPRFIGSEYTQDPQLRRDLYPIEAHSLLDLSLQPDAFDAVLVNDVFEHIPDIPRALAQIHRVLQPRGVLISTFPFAAFAGRGPVKALQTANGLQYLAEPEYHEDPLDPRGALVYQIPGWDILGDCRQAGYADARMVYILSERRGILAPDIGGVLVLLASKAPGEAIS